MALTKIKADGLTADLIDETKLADNSIDSEHYNDGSIDNAHLADDAVGVAELSATGTASSSTFLRGDNSWATPTATTINNNADNRVITGSGTANTLNGESGLTYDSGGMAITGDSDRDGLKITQSGNNYGEFMFNSNRSSANNALGIIRSEWNSTEVASIYLTAGSDTTNKDDGQIKFFTSPDSGTGIQNRMTIDSTGAVIGSGLGTNNDSTRNVKGLVLKSTAGISFENFGANGSKNWRVRPDDASAWGALDFSVGDTENDSTSWPNGAGDLVLSLRGNRDVHVDNGNLVIGTAGKGIDFSAQTASSATGASASSELLNHYEYGTFTPTYSGTWTNIGNSNVRQAKYTRIGNVVHIWLEYFMTSNDGAFSDQAEIRGFPYSSGLQSLYVPPSLGIMYGPSNYSMDDNASGRMYFDAYAGHLVFRMGSVSGVRHIWVQLTYTTG